mgnify:CR=1
MKTNHTTASDGLAKVEIKSANWIGTVKAQLIVEDIITNTTIKNFTLVDCT